MERNWFYTNSFAVRDRAAFMAFCQGHGLEFFEEAGHLGCFHLARGLHQILEESDESVFLRTLAGHIQEGWVAIIVDASVTERDRCDCSWQITYAVNARGEVRFINPYTIFEVAQTLGAHISPLQDMWTPSVREVGEGGDIAQRSALPSHPRSELLPRWLVYAVADTLCRLLLDSLPPEVGDKDLTGLQREGLLRLGTLRREYGVLPTNSNTWLENLIKREEERESQERVGRFETFSTRCPFCGQESSITVIEVTLTQTFQVLQVEVPLHGDGFDISGYCNPLLKDLSTQDERVRCTTCGKGFALSELLN